MYPTLLPLGQTCTIYKVAVNYCADRSPCIWSAVMCFALVSVMSPNPSKGYDRCFCIRMKSTLTKRGVHFKSSGYRVRICHFHAYTDNRNVFLPCSNTRCFLHCFRSRILLLSLWIVTAIDNYYYYYYYSLLRQTGSTQIEWTQTTNSPAGAVAKYCMEYVCLWVCLSARISPEPHMRSLPNFLCLLPMSEARSSFDMFTIGRIACRREGVFIPTENALSAEKGDVSAQRGRSMLSTIALFCLPK